MGCGWNWKEEGERFQQLVYDLWMGDEYRERGEWRGLGDAGRNGSVSGCACGVWERKKGE